MTAEIMTTAHPEWEKFIELLSGPEGLNGRKGKNGEHIDDCKGGLPIATKILKSHFPNCGVEESLAFFRANGGYCDCEVMWNVALPRGPRKRKRKKTIKR